MKLTTPEYLKASDCQDNAVHYAWDDWHEIRELRVPDKALVTRLESVSQRAVLAFATGTAEWIVYRFDHLCDTTAAWNFIETAWAMIVHLRYSIGDESWNYYSEKGWEGPIKRPIKKALAYLDSAFSSLHSEYHKDPSNNASRIANLTCYVMSDPTPYKTWGDQVLSRFETLYPRIVGDPIGDVIPRQAVDPNSDFQVAQTERLINEFLAGLDYKSNSFLRAPESMFDRIEGEEDFVGTPYVFDMVVDRQTRPRRQALNPRH